MVIIYDAVIFLILYFLNRIILCNSLRIRMRAIIIYIAVSFEIVEFIASNTEIMIEFYFPGRSY